MVRVRLWATRSKMNGDVSLFGEAAASLTINLSPNTAKRLVGFSEDEKEIVDRKQQHYKLVLFVFFFYFLLF